MADISRTSLAAALLLAGSAWITPSVATEAASAVSTAPYVMPSRIPDAIKKAIQSPTRPVEMSARDANRKPAELLWLANVRKGNRVVELGSAGNYFTTLLAEIVGEKGMVHMYDLPITDAAFGDASRAFAAAHPNTRYESVDFNQIEIPRQIDLVLSVNYFNEMLRNNVELELFHSKVFKAMKAGGIYLVVDHNARIGSDALQTLQLRRIDPSVVRQNIQAAGFQLVEESRLLQNLSDDYSLPVDAPEIKDRSDQTVYVFRKPIIY